MWATQGGNAASRHIRCSSVDWTGLIIITVCLGALVWGAVTGWNKPKKKG